VQDHYAILHVLPSAEDDVIKAAYRALSKRYHPDIFTGDKAFATKRMQEINAAYEVLGSLEQRKKYNKVRDNASVKSEFSEMASDEDARFNEDWKLACKFAPKAESCFAYLKKLSNSLAFSYAAYLLDNKKFEHSVSIATNFQRAFLGEYFGSVLAIQDFGRDLLLCGEIQAAKVVNKAVKVMGKSLSYRQIKENILNEYPQIVRKLLFLNIFKSYNNYHDIVSKEALQFLQMCGVKVKAPSIFGFGGWGYRITYSGNEHTVVNPIDFDNWVINKFGDTEEFREVWKGPIL
jgi:curved DNA-binding protein CbpA